MYRKLLIAALCLNVVWAIVLYDKPSQDADLLKVSDLNDITVLKDKYLFVKDNKSKITGYVKAEDYEREVTVHKTMKQNPQAVTQLSQQLRLTEKVAIMNQSMKNRQAQINQLSSRLTRLTK